MKLAQKVKGGFSRIRWRSPFGTAPPPATIHRYTNTNTNSNNNYNTSTQNQKLTSNSDADYYYQLPIAAAPGSSGASVAAAIKAIGESRKYRLPVSPVRTSTTSTNHVPGPNISSSSSSSSSSHRFVASASSLAELVVCRHTTKASIVTTPERPDIEFEAPRADEIASYHAFVDALNRGTGSGSGHSNGSSSGSGNDRRRKYTKSSLQPHFGAFGLVTAVAALLSNPETAKCEGKDKSGKDKPAKQKHGRKPFTTFRDIVSGLSRSPDKSNPNSNSSSPAASPPLKPWSPNANTIDLATLCIDAYAPFTVEIPKSKSKPAAPQQQPPHHPIKLNTHFPVSGTPTLPHKPATAMTGSDEKSNKENMKPSSAVASASSAAAAELAAENETARLSIEEERALAEARVYFDPKVDADGTLVLGRADIINPAKWKELALYLTCTGRVSSLRLQNVDIDAEAARILSAVGRTNKTLRHVTLCDNGIGDAANLSARRNDSVLNSLVDFLLRCLLLESLAVLRNRVRDEHVPAIQNLLSRHQSLMRLSLCWNGIEDSGAKALAKALETYTSELTDIDLSYNAISESGRKHVTQCAEQYALSRGPGRRTPRFHLDHNRSRVPWLQPHGALSDPIAVG